MPHSDLVQSLIRAMDILEIAAHSEKGIRLSDAAEALKVKAPTAHNLIRTLISKGFLEKTEEGFNRIGGKFFALADEAKMKRSPIWAKDTLKEISEKYPFLTITYSARRGNRISPLLRMSPDRRGLMQHNLEMGLSLYSSASGLAFLSFAPDPEVESIREAVPFVENGSGFWGNFENFQSFVEDVRKKGYAIPPFKGMEKCAVASPVFNEKNVLDGILGLSVPGGKSDDKTKNEVISNSLKYSGKLTQILKTGGFL